MDEGKTNGQMDTVGQATLPTILMKQETLKKKLPLQVRPSLYSSFCIYSAKHLLTVNDTRALTTCMVAEISRHLQEYNCQN